MPRCAASDDDDPLGVDKFLLVVGNSVEHYPTAAVDDTTANTVAQSVGLLKDLLEHKMIVAPLLHLRDGELELGDVDLDLLVFQSQEFEGLAALDDRNLLIFDIDDLLGVFHDGSAMGRASEGMKNSSLPIPTTRGLLFLAAIIWSGASFAMTAIA